MAESLLVLVGYVASETVPFFAHGDRYGKLSPKAVRFPMANIMEILSSKAIHQKWPLISQKRKNTEGIAITGNDVVGVNLFSKNCAKLLDLLLLDCTPLPKICCWLVAAKKQENVTSRGLCSLSIIYSPVQNRFCHIHT